MLSTRTSTSWIETSTIRRSSSPVNETTSPEPSSTWSCSVCERGLALRLDLDPDPVVVERLLEVGERRVRVVDEVGHVLWKALTCSATGLARIAPAMASTTKNPM